MIIKICGITSLKDAMAAAAAGADMLGYNFYQKSVRAVTPARCLAIQSEMRRRGIVLQTVGVFVNASNEQILDVLGYCGLDYAQLHGDEPPSQVNALGNRAFKALRLRRLPEARAQAAALDRRSPPALLIDTYSPARYGGSGQPGDWTAAASLAAEFPLLLAGGLTPENVAAAIEQVRPWGVDVASGVECRPGVKEHRELRAFVAEARSAAS